MIEIIPGIQEDSFLKIEEKIHLVEPYASWIHLDITDKTLTTSESFRDPEPFKNLKTKLNFEVHLMVADPVKVAKSWHEAGFKRLIAHVEGNDPRDFIEECNNLGVETGLAIDGPTPLEEIEPFLEEIDQVLVMMYKAGPSGQKFQTENLEKIRFIRENYPVVPIEVDGGINQETARWVKESGATRLVSTSFLFWQNGDHVGEAIEVLKNA